MSDHVIISNISNIIIIPRAPKYCLRGYLGSEARLQNYWAQTLSQKKFKFNALLSSINMLISWL